MYQIGLKNILVVNSPDAFVAYHPATAWHYLNNGYYNDYSVSEASKDYPKFVSEFSKLGLFEKKGHGVLFSMGLFMAMFWGERIMFVVASFTMTGIEHVQFCLNHFSSEIYVGPPKGNYWFEKQTSGTLDIACPSWMYWFQAFRSFSTKRGEEMLAVNLPDERTSELISHLLFGDGWCQMCGPSNQDSVEDELIAEHTRRDTLTGALFLKANALTFKTLNTAALQVRDLTKPILKNRVWEAVNTHG
uniref:Delta(8)-fatty-acid desaturase-like n=1 Tax=Nicotiana sylvestris TaxID=4096 RepID=A0A1U7XY46_NICSY|nr:PREDICTED: delta(8)-fatty-acid desaturase-like [Nicotiana sylvestris]